MGGHIDSVDVGVLLDATKDNGIETGLDVATVEVVSISAYGSDSDQSFVVALRDRAGEVGAVQITILKRGSGGAAGRGGGCRRRHRGAVALHRGAVLVELVRLREPSS